MRAIIKSAAVAVRYAFGWLLLAVIVVFLAWLRGCWPFAGYNQPKPAEPLKISVSEWLDYCSPFEALSGQRMLTFTVADHSVIAAEALGEEKAKGALFAAHPQKTKGVWAADEDTHGVSVEISGSKSEYTLLIPFSEDQCILVSGSLLAADLTNSLFATPNFPKPDPSE
jgi:hypothetical protein